VPGTAFPGDTGNAAIAAHRDSFFQGLGGVSKGNDIVVNTRQGTFHYVVESTEIVRPNDVRVLRPSASPELTLITCYPFHMVGPAPKRFIIHAVMANEFARRDPNAERQDR
jgi:sortase A